MCLGVDCKELYHSARVLVHSLCLQESEMNQSASWTDKSPNLPDANLESKCNELYLTLPTTKHVLNKYKKWVLLLLLLLHHAKGNLPFN